MSVYSAEYLGLVWSGRFIANSQRMRWEPFKRWMPRSVSQQCLLGIVLGLGMGLLLGSRSDMFGIVGQIYIRSLTLVTLPYLIFELISCISSLSPSAANRFFRRGLWLFLGVLVMGAGSVVAASLILPNLPTSPLFDPAMLDHEKEVDLVTSLLPSNLFAALAQGNYAAITLVSVFLGLIIQRLPERDALLAIVMPVRCLLNRVMMLVVRGLLPIGLFAITAESIGKADPGVFQRMAGLIVVLVVPVLVLVTVVLPGALYAILGIRPKEFFGMIRDPLMIILSTGNPWMALPTLRDSLESELKSRGILGDDLKSDVAAMEAYVLIGMSVFTLGKFISLSFIPFAAWSIDMPITPMRTLQMLPTGLPSVAGGAYLSILGELRRIGLPESLASQYLVNVSWIVRLTDLATLVAAAGGSLVLVLPARLNPLRLMSVMLAGLSAFGGLGFLGHWVLSSSLKESNRSSAILRRQRLMETNVPVAINTVDQPPTPDSVTPVSIRARGVLRVGIMGPKVPWIYYNTQGELVGYDVELAVALANSLGVKVEFSELDRKSLERWLREGRIDLVIGGIGSSPFRHSLFVEGVTYDEVHLGLLVHDSKVGEFQRIASGIAAQNIVLGYDEQAGLSAEVKLAIRSQLGVSRFGNGAVVFVPFSGQKEAIQGLGKRFDAIITSVEEGSAVAVMEPDLTMIPAFGRRVPYYVGLLTRNDYVDWVDYLRDWWLDNQLLGLGERLRAHWFSFRRSATTQ